MHERIAESLAELLRETEAMSSDSSASIEELLREGLENPISADHVRALLTNVVEVIRDGAESRGDSETVNLLDRDAEAFIARVEKVRAGLSASAGTSSPTTNAAEPDTTSRPSASGQNRLHLQSYDGIDPAPVRPMPVFHERPVAVVEGFVRTRKSNSGTRTSGSTST